MAEILTRTYTYTGQSGWKSGESSVALSSFTKSGDTRPITQILSISASWYRYHDTSSTVVHAAELVFSNGTTLKSNGVTKRGDQGKFNIESSFMDMPDAANWVESRITLRTTLSTKLNHVYWHATSTQPMVLTITYLSSEFKPYIKNATIYRADSLGATADEGAYLNFKATVGVEKLGKNDQDVEEQSGTLVIYDENGVQRFSESVSLSASTLDAKLSEAKFASIGSSAATFRMKFFYTAILSTTTFSEETAELSFRVNSLFTNVHLAGTKKGGVAFGQYSTSNDKTAKFECKYPAYFYGGIAQIGNGSGNLLELLGVEHGSIASMTLAGETTSTKTVTFPRAFATAPDVVATFDSSSISSFSGRWDYLTLTVYNITATGFTIRVHNGTSTSFAPGIRWIAVGTPTN